MRHLLILASFFIFHFVNAQKFQNTQIDSLKAILNQVDAAQKTSVCNQLSILYRNTNTERALHYAKEALNLAIENEDAKAQIEANINAGVVLRNFGKSDDALNYFFNALEIDRKNLYPQLTADAIHKIGVTYLLVNDFENAISYAKDEISIWQKINDKSGLASALNLLGLIQINVDDYENAAKNLKKSLTIGYSIEDTSQIYKPLVNLGDLYLKHNKPDSALLYIKKSREVSMATGNTYGLAIASLKEGQALKAIKKYELAEEKIRTALINAERLNSLSLVRNCYQNLAQLFEESDNHRNALMYYKLYIATEDSMLSEITRRKIAQIETEYKLRNKNSEIAQLKELSNAQKIQIAIVISLLLLLIPAFYMLYIKLRKSKNLKQKISSLENKLTKSNQLSEKLKSKENDIDNLKEILTSHGSEYLTFFSNHFLYQHGNKKRNNITFHLLDDTFFILAFSFHNCDDNTILKSIFLDNIIAKILSIRNKSLSTPSNILKEIEDNLNTFNKNFNVEKDQVNASVLSININSKRVVYAGAGIPIYTIRHQNLHIVSGNSLALRSPETTTESFTNKTFHMNKHEQIFMFLESGDNKALTEENIRLILAKHDTHDITKTKKALLKGLEQWVPEFNNTESSLIFGLEI